MTHALDRRGFLKSAAAASATVAASRAAAASAANNTVVLAIMGTNGRGSALARGFAGQENCRVAYICDVDQRAVGKGIGAAVAGGGKEPQGLKDFRKALDDKSVDALVCAAPNHWHGPATILGCSAGKHVYVEKPCCHNPGEGEMMIAAARKHDRVVTMGTQRRSAPLFREAIDKLREGVIGEVLYSNSWYNNRRGSIGRGKATDVPKWLDYSLWQGPAPERPFVDNLVHYNWHWRWHWGNGELGNNGVHSIDISRWGLGVDFPTRVTSGGGRLRYDDDQQTPDTNVVTFDFDGRTITWHGMSWSPLGYDRTMFGISFHGEKGTLVLSGSGYTIYDMKNKKVATSSGGSGNNEHQMDFLEAIRQGRRANADIEEAHKSTLLCHLGNIAYRTGRTLHTDPNNGHIQADTEAAAMWGREYRPGWEPVV